ncbi:MAG: 50S ribosomal protein L22 [Nanoarchaeota archaeon]|nr:50S ribosomal protein L22 [Nanoarchaeota archaeon]
MVETKKEANTAKVTGRGMPISAKSSTEICRTIRNQRLDSAKKILQDVKEQKQAISFKRFKSSVSHRRGMGPGKYPVKAATEILHLLESAEANAQFKGLNTTDLTIIQSIANSGSRPHRYGRQRRRKAKRTHITIVVAEGVAKEEKSTKKREPVKKEAPVKEEAKKETPKAKEAAPEVKEPVKEADPRPKKETPENIEVKKND